MTQKNMLEKVAKGIYIDSVKIEDVYYVLSISTPKIIYSHMTALYFHNLSIKAPDSSFDITVTKKYNNPKLKKIMFFMLMISTNHFINFYVKYLIKYDILFI